MMDTEFAMREELYSTDFCFPRYDLYNPDYKYDLTQKFYIFDCGVGNFCCYADEENIQKIINVAKKYKLEDLFLNKSFSKNALIEFKNKTVDELRKKENLGEDFPVVFYFRRNLLFVTDIYLKDYLNS
jgi:hypothetical protein